MSQAPENNQQTLSAKRGGHYLLKVFLLLIVAAAGAAGYFFYDAQRFLDTPPQVSGKNVIVRVERGAALKEIADSLQQQGMITDSLRFQLLARWREKAAKLQAGTFLMNSGWLPQRVLDELVSGKTMLHRLTIREGLPWWTVAELAESEGFCTATDFEKVIHDKDFLLHHGIPFANAEGFLYPDTYLLLMPEVKDEKAARVLADRLVNTFWSKADTLWEKRPDRESLRRLLVLASIVERETRLPDERPRVAGVYGNRLQKNMLLQADPTLIYGLGKDFTGPLLKKHLNDVKNPYNTYLLPGLPPGPICSPSLYSLAAALHPEQHDFLYFVASGKDASHVFSKNLSDHNRAVRQYRENIKK